MGETVAIGLTAFTTSGEIQEIRLIVNNIERDEVTIPPLTSDPDFGGYVEDSQEYGDDTGQSSLDANIQRLDRWKYDGTMPDYNIYFTPSDVGMYNIEAKIIDHTGYSTITSSYRIRVTNGEPPVIELMSPRTENLALDYVVTRISAGGKHRIPIVEDLVVTLPVWTAEMSLAGYGSLRMINLVSVIVFLIQIFISLSGDLLWKVPIESLQLLWMIR